MTTTKFAKGPRVDSTGLVMRDGEGEDSDGRLHTVSALARFKRAFKAIAAQEEFPNSWNVAKNAVEQVTKSDGSPLAGRALEHLLALDHFAEEERFPMVAMRNVRVGDIVQSSGTSMRVKEVNDDAENRGPERHIGLVLEPPNVPGGQTRTERSESGVRIPLIARPVPTDGGLR